ncbi:MAG: protein phosphatase 2C domain-containing protein [Deltaproteobacteria bacterium]|nr:protein phosphatase 2C domain-containing protein [Deltaproteobacteria bacterium]
MSKSASVPRPRAPELAEPSAAPPAPAARDRTEAGAERLHGEALVVPRFDYRIDFCALSAMGPGRAKNQDAVLCRPAGAVFALADGMGGHAAGEVAARLALGAVAEELESPKAATVLDRYADDPKLDNRRRVFELLRRAVYKANDAVVEASRSHEGRRGMGTTLDVAVLVRDRAFVAHVGDSRAYLVRPAATLQLTHDHVSYDSLRSSGKRPPPKRWAASPLSNCIGSGAGVVVDSLSVDLGSTDRLVLCTDGTYGPLEAEGAAAVLCQQCPPAELCDRMIRSAREQGGLDDASILAIEVGERFVTRSGDPGLRAHDLAVVSSSPLLESLPVADMLSTLCAGVEVEFEPGESIPRAAASDRVAYLILDGLVELPGGRTLGPSGLLMAESLVDVVARGELPVAVERCRLLRIRHDDFTGICAHDPELAARLYKRLARHLAKVGPTV